MRRGIHALNAYLLGSVFFYNCFFKVSMEGELDMARRERKKEKQKGEGGEILRD